MESKDTSGGACIAADVTAQVVPECTRRVTAKRTLRTSEKGGLRTLPICVGLLKGERCSGHSLYRQLPLWRHCDRAITKPCFQGFARWAGLELLRRPEAA